VCAEKGQTSHYCHAEKRPLFFVQCKNLFGEIQKGRRETAVKAANSRLSGKGAFVRSRTSAGVTL
jgi:hypothetical protein